MKKINLIVSIKTKLLLLSCVLFICPIIIIGYLGFRNYKQTTKERFTYYAQKDINTITRQLDQQINTLKEFSMNILYDNLLYDFYKQRNNILKSKQLGELFSYKKDFESHLKSLLKSYDYIEKIGVQFYINNDGVVFGATNNFTNINTNEIPINKINTEAKKHIDSFFYYEQKTGNIKDIYFARNFYNLEDFSKIGIIIFKLKKDDLFNQFNYLYNDPIKSLYILTDDENLLWSTSALTKKYISKDWSDYCVSSHLSQTNWNIITYISPDILLNDLDKVAHRVVLLCIITIPILLLIIKLFYQNLIKPIYLLVNKMDLIEKGELGQQISYKRNDEIGYLLNSFNNMSAEIKHLINCVYREELALKDSEIKALQSQINPHFLFNTLETINWKALLSGNEEISEMIQALADITEVNIDRKNNRFMTLQKELNYMDNYILLIKKRFGDKIKFIKIIDKALYNSEIPKLIIQPLIENAIYHGIGPIGEGTIKINIYKNDNHIIISVEDNGVGIEQKELKQLQLQLNKSDSTYDDINSNSKIGMINVHKRIRLIYGQQYGLRIRSDIKGTKVKLLIPLKTGENYEKSTVS